MFIILMSLKDFYSLNEVMALFSFLFSYRHISCLCSFVISL
ncbi:hypothetical protein HMPREF1860_01489 [Prevotella amnii]|uniref:Uncharacterized protein n=1 Tax=Prevotella amnii TaxID=419005 RepID=A0A134BBJ3_9BACT|nr:hypothetical protein HMPREF1860_01489 [Prevotella amnii]